MEFVWIKHFFFLAKFNNFDLCFWFCQYPKWGSISFEKNKTHVILPKTPNFSLLPCPQIGNLNLNVNFGGKAFVFESEKAWNKIQLFLLMSEYESCRIIPRILLLGRRTAVYCKEMESLLAWVMWWWRITLGNKLGLLCSATFSWPS